MERKISQNGVDLIKSFEKCKLKAYKAVETEKYWTIGWGHYGSDVYEGMVITQEKADSLFLTDIIIREDYVNSVSKYLPELNQNQFDALVSFCYNCGVGNLKDLCVGQNLNQISKNILLYNKSSGVVLNGLVRRRKTEQDLFNKKDVLNVSDESIDFILSVLGYYWNDMKGNIEVQNYTHFVANQFREAVGRKEE